MPNLQLKTREDICSEACSLHQQDQHKQMYTQLLSFKIIDRCLKFSSTKAVLLQVGESTQISAAALHDIWDWHACSLTPLSNSKR